MIAKQSRLNWSILNVKSTKDFGDYMNIEGYETKYLLYCKLNSKYSFMLYNSQMPGIKIFLFVTQKKLVLFFTFSQPH